MTFALFTCLVPVPLLVQQWKVELCRRDTASCQKRKVNERILNSIEKGGVAFCINETKL